MPALTQLTKSIRAAEYLEVVRLMNEGKTQKDACENVGISAESFRRFRDENPEALQIFQDQISETTRQQIGHILSRRALILKMLVDDAIADSTSPKDRLAIFNKLEEHLDKLAIEARLGGADDSAATDVLGGPMFTKAESRFSVKSEEQDGKMTTTVTIEQERPPIIDVNPQTDQASPEDTMKLLPPNH